MVINKERRMTNQRLKVLEHLNGMDDHPTAEQVYREVKKELPAITLATVYRNLNKLASDGDIRKLEINHEYRFDSRSHSHIHIFCEKCGKIHDIIDDNIMNDISSKVGKKFKVWDVNIIIRGSCK